MLCPAKTPPETAQEEEGGKDMSNPDDPSDRAVERQAAVEEWQSDQHNRTVLYLERCLTSDDNLEAT
jgi:hypothetical protein